MEDIRQTAEWEKYLESIGWIVEKIHGIRVFIKKLPLSPFSMMKIQRYHGEVDLEGLKRLKKKYRVIYTVIEPMNKKVIGWKINKHPFLPSKTLVVDLTKDEKELWDDLSLNTRRILKKDHPIKVCEFSSKKNRVRFYGAWKKMANTWLMSHARFNKLLNAFGGKGSLWVSKSQDELLSGIVLLKSGDTANYFQTWTSSKGRKLGSHYYLVWQTILKCKKEGLRWFDFEGIFDERWPQKRWRGFSEFKKKFGGKVVKYPGSLSRWF